MAASRQGVWLSGRRRVRYRGDGSRGLRKQSGEGSLGLRKQSGEGSLGRIEDAARYVIDEIGFELGAQRRDVANGFSAIKQRQDRCLTKLLRCRLGRGSFPALQLAS
jgi:hypothetical protein